VKSKRYLADVSNAQAEMKRSILRVVVGKLGIGPIDRALTVLDRTRDMTFSSHHTKKKVSMP
jgi:hypothetical protein